jgi:hypothetical protein
MLANIFALIELIDLRRKEPSIVGGKIRTSSIDVFNKLFAFSVSQQHSSKFLLIPPLRSNK